MARQSATTRQAASNRTTTTAREIIDLNPARRNYAQIINSSQLIYLGSATQLNHTTDDFSIECWIKTRHPGTASGAYIIKRWGSSRPGYHLMITGGGYIRFALQGVTSATATSSAKINDGKWHHIVCVNSRNIDSKIHIYVDGVLAGSSAALAMTDIGNTTDRAQVNLSYAWFVGQIDDIRHYSVALSADQVALRYAGTDITTGLANRWKFDELENSNSYYNYNNSTDDIGGIVISDFYAVSRLRSAESRRPIAEPLLRFGIITDLHHATAGHGTGTDQRSKLTVAMNRFRQRKLNFVVALGDMIDVGSADPDAISEYNTVVNGYADDITFYSILGNHEAYDLEGTDAIVYDLAGFPDLTPFHYKLVNGVHLLFLCWSRDYTSLSVYKLGADQWQWLESAMDATRGEPTVVFMHYRLDQSPPGDGTAIGGQSVYHYEAGKLRDMFEAHGGVKLVCSGHEHGFHYGKVNGINYLTQAALQDGRYRIVQLNADFTVQSEEYGNTGRSFYRR